MVQNDNQFICYLSIVEPGANTLAFHECLLARILNSPLEIWNEPLYVEIHVLVKFIVDGHDLFKETVVQLSGLFCHQHEREWIHLGT